MGLENFQAQKLAVIRLQTNLEMGLENELGKQSWKTSLENRLEEQDWKTANKLGNQGLKSSLEYKLGKQAWKTSLGNMGKMGSEIGIEK